ncbi:hypothetical protein K491DRAFT_629678 [Lophiostoma macrostomum CBS 122681]|uniref:Uncharacterized protein n=1 Tax=Lophiostoma macrostomum CBS 122681 TaxID=1314788 RepID=A0A6A6T8W2_9PLEO|nr:hypothetical protein K491DRAFT_629678 [Lophiostoma macrostomum CBS 122681]
MLSFPILLLSLAATALTAPSGPPQTFLYSAAVTGGQPSIIGAGPLGTRAVIPVVNGTFSGPKLNGTIHSGVIWTLTSSTGVNTADAVYVLTTSDGANIMVTEKAHLPNVDIFFETGSSKYAWLNNVTAFALDTPTTGVSEIEVYAIGSTV